MFPTPVQIAYIYYVQSMGYGKGAETTEALPAVTSGEETSLAKAAKQNSLFSPTHIFLDSVLHLGCAVFCCCRGCCGEDPKFVQKYKDT